MIGLIKEELFHIIRKKRFILLTAIAIIGVLVTSIITKNKYLNDLTYFFAIDNYIFYVFNSVIGFALIISVYRKKYTKNSIIQVEEHGVNRLSGVISRTISCSLILIVCYALTILFIIVLGLILGANLSSVQTGELALKLTFDCLACITTYVIAQFWLYLFAFPVVPVIIYELLMLGATALYHVMSGGYIANTYRIIRFISPKALTDSIYTNVLLYNNNIKYYSLLLLQITVPFLLTLIVFKLKKKERKKKKSRVSAQEES